MKYLKDTSKEFIKSKLDTLNKDNQKFVDIDKLYISLFPIQMNAYQTPNERLEIRQLLVGAYPAKSDELLIPEISAISLGNKLGVDSYKQVIGQRVTLFGDDYKIGGVYSGGNHIIAYPSEDLIPMYKQYLDEAIFVKFNNKHQRNQFFRQFNNEQFVNSRDFYIDNIKFALPRILEVVIMIFGILFVINK